FIYHQTETLALEILEIEREVAEPLLDGAGAYPAILQMLLPPFQRFRAAYAQAGAAHRVVAALLAGGGEIEEGKVGAGGGDAVAIKEVIGRGVVLIHRLLDEANAQRLGIEFQVARRIGGYRRQ